MKGNDLTREQMNKGEERLVHFGMLLGGPVTAVFGSLLPATVVELKNSSCRQDAP